MNRNLFKKSVIIILAALCIAGCRGKTTPAVIITSDVGILEASEYDKLKNDNLGKVLVVNVFATWCPPCEKETPGFVKVYNELGGENFELIGLSIDARKRDIISFINFYEIKYPVYQIKSNLQHRLYASKVPTTLIYHPDGTLYRTVLGMISEEHLTYIVNNLKKSE